MARLQRCLLSQLVIGFLVVESQQVYSGEKVNENFIPYGRIIGSLKDLKDDYGDIPSKVICSKHSEIYEKIICRSNYLRKLALLNSRARAYAIDNAHHQETTNHAEAYGGVPEACSKKKYIYICIYNFYKEEIELFSRWGITLCAA